MWQFLKHASSLTLQQGGGSLSLYIWAGLLFVLITEYGGSNTIMTSDVKKGYETSTVNAHPEGHASMASLICEPILSPSDTSGHYDISQI